MALRLYKCKCGRETQEIYPGKYPRTIKCQCGRRAKVKWTAPGLCAVDFRPGYDVGLGQYFNTRREKDNYLVKHNLHEVKSLSGWESASVPDTKEKKLAYLAYQESKLKRG